MAGISNPLKNRANVGSSSGLAPEHGDQFSPPEKVPRATVESSPRSQAEPVLFQEPLKKLNDNVFEVCKPIGRPSVEIVFFHGLQLKQSSLMDAQCHVTTWLSRDKSKLWLKWLLKKFPEARILTILYDASARRTDYEGLMDMYLTSENLMQSITGSIEARIGQDGCPVVLVGHCLGGLVMKNLCVLANSKVSLNHINKPGIRALDNLLRNVKGLFSYATPHQGFRLADRYTEVRKGELYKMLKTLNKDIARLNEDFRMLREKNEWKTFGIGECHEVTPDQGNLTEIVVSEASTRHDVDGFYTVAANHYDVCRPVNKQCSSFQLLETFVAGVLNEVKPIQTDLLAGINIVGLEASVNNVIEKLLTPKAKRLAIVGIGGIGKTTLAKALFGKISRDFEYTCFVDKVKEKMTDEENSSKLREEIILKGMKRSGYDVHKSFQWSTLIGKKVLIMLDDVEFESQVNVMTESDGFSEESRLVVTSRNSRFLEGQNFEIHKAETLSLDDSKTLFCLCAFNQRNAHQGKEELVTEFAEKCAGLPLALKVSGKYLCNQKDDADWKAALENLRKAKPLNGSADNDGLWSILRVSYDSLAESEREMFLDAATYLSGEKLEYAKEIWRFCSWGAKISGWRNLSDRSLVSEDMFGRIQMHDVLRDMGRSIAGQSRKLFDAISQLMQLHDREKEKVKILSLGGEHLDHYYYMDANALSKFESLEILYLNTVLLDGPVSHVLPKLAVLRWAEVFMSEVDNDSSRSEEVVAGLRNLFEVQSLRYIMLDDLPIQHLPIASDQAHLLSQLEHLEIRSCQKLVALPNELEQLQKLSYVAITSCSSLKELPDSFAHLGTLERLEIAGCASLLALPAGFGRLRRLHLLSITKCHSLKELPDSFVLLDALKRLKIRDCPELEISLSCLDNLRSLQHLDIFRCKKITGIDAQGGWYQLSSNRSNPDDGLQWVLSEDVHVGQSLSFEEFYSMRATGDHNEGLVRGVLVNSDGVYYRGKLANLPRSLGGPQRVQRLHITGWAKEVMDLQNFEELQDLTIEDRHSLELPRFLGQPGKLQRMRINRWMSLKVLSSTLQHLQLQCLEIERCHSLVQALPHTLGNLRKLQCLKIIHCKSLKALPDSLGDLQELQHLQIEFCNSLKALPNSLGDLQELQHLQIDWCNSLEALPDSLGDLQKLQHLQIDWCNSLNSLPDSLGDLQKLQHLQIDWCNSLNSLPDTLGDLCALQDLKIAGWSLKALPYTLGRLQNLVSLEIVDCPKLQTLPDSIGQLSWLRRLKICDCRRLEALPNIFGLLQDLKTLEISGCRSLKTLPESVCHRWGNRSIFLITCDYWSDGKLRISYSDENEMSDSDVDS